MCRSAIARGKGCCCPAGPRGPALLGALVGEKLAGLPRFGTAACGCRQAPAARRRGKPCSWPATGYHRRRTAFRNCCWSRRPAGPLATTALSSGVPPCGLGAADTLRLEAAMHLYGQEHGPSPPPPPGSLAGLAGSLRCRLDFIGRAALERQDSRRVSLGRLVGLKLQGRAIARHGLSGAPGWKPWWARITSGTGHRRLAEAIAPGQRQPRRRKLGNRTAGGRFGGQPHRRLCEAAFLSAAVGGRPALACCHGNSQNSFPLPRCAVTDAAITCVVIVDRPFSSAAGWTAPRPWAA